MSSTDNPEFEHSESKETDITTEEGAELHRAEATETSVDWPDPQADPEEEPQHEPEEGSDTES